jgi:hypothetical protein
MLESNPFHGLQTLNALHFSIRFSWLLSVVYLFRVDGLAAILDPVRTPMRHRGTNKSMQDPGFLLERARILES